jgi:mycothiol synthase
MTARLPGPPGGRGPLPEGYVLRRPATNDLAAAQAVLDAAESADTGESRRHETDLAEEWSDPDCHLDEDWWVLVAPTGEIAAVAWVWPETAGEVTADHYVHPEHRGRGLGDLLLDLIAARVAELPSRAPDGSPRSLFVWCEDSDVVRRAALDARAFTPIRQYYEMAIDLGAAPEAPRWPPGVAVRAFRQGVDERAVHEADMEAFAEHFLFEPRTFEAWLRRHVEAPLADPALWRLAWEGAELAGYVIPFEMGDEAVIGDLAVRQPWRGRGIGRALLLAALALLRERGRTAARLYVDAANVTNALRVYEAAGMHVARRFDVMKRPLV